MWRARAYPLRPAGDREDTGRPIRQRSLSFRFVAAIILAELLFGALLGLAVSVTSLRLASEDRRASLTYVTSVVAASIMPLIADQDPARIDAQLDSIIGLPQGYEIECIRIADTSGRVLAESKPECTCDEVGEDVGLLALFTQEQVVEQPIVIDDLPVAVASVQFHPVGLEQALWEPLRVTLLVVLVVVVLSSLWGTWLTLRTVVEPIESLRDGAERIASGERDLDLWNDRADEIGQLARSLDEMMMQLEEKEERLLQSYHSLEDALRAQERLGHELQKTISVRSDFVAVASHELRSPLAVIRLYGELMASGELGQLDPKVQDAVRSIVSAATRLGSIMTNLMDVALLERGIMPLDFGDVRLDAVVHAAIEDASALGASKGVEVRAVGELPEVTVRADRLRVRQVLDNLLSNATRYSKESSKVDVSLTQSDESARICVRDRGQGIPEGRRHVLFEPFGRVEVDESAVSSGLGLGLAISARIAEAHGGWLGVRDPEEGPGTVFELMLPRNPGHEVSGVRVVPD